MKGLREFLLRSGPGRWGLGLALLLVFIALAAPWLAPYDPTAQNLPARLLGPSAAHWMARTISVATFSRAFSSARAFRCLSR